MLLLAAACWMAPCVSGFAHDGPEHEIEELTERIQHEGESASLLLKRAIEYNVLGKSGDAAKELERALHFAPDSAPIRRELSRAYFASGKTNDAINTATRGLKDAEEGHELASLLMVRAEVLRAKQEYKKALDDADRAIREHSDNAEWYLMRSQLHELLKLTKERVQGLEEGIKETGSGLLEAEWIDALIADGRPEVALARIEKELKSSRLKSSWLIRHARVYLATGKTAEAKADLVAALAELNERIDSSAPDPLLLADRGMARELLGEKDDARKDFEQARDKGLTDEWLRDRIRQLKDEK